MGWRDREYTNESYSDGEFAGSPRGRRPTGATLVLMILHGAAFLLALLLHLDATARASIEASGVLAGPLLIAVHPFLTANILTIVFVLLALWSLGGRLEAHLGAPRVVLLYLIANLAAGGVFFAFYKLAPPTATAVPEYPIGALASFVVVAWDVLKHDMVSIFGRVTSAAKVYAISAGLVVTLQLLTAQGGALAWVLAAAGGGASALLTEQIWALGGRWRERRRMQVRRKATRPARTVSSDQPEIDAILAKISRSGLHSLTRDEMRRLEAARRELLKRST